MPELPEVENVRRGLAGTVLGRCVVGVTLQRLDVVHGPSRPADLLRGRTITRIDRLGKQLALVGTPRQGPDDGRTGPCICIHLGMTGSLRHYPSGVPAPQDIHTHVRWRLENGGELVFRDPRRFGGLWTYPSVEALDNERWSRLGQDALAITPRRLHAGLQRTRRPLKAALLDQAVVAGLGNIYVDELLFACRLSPVCPANACQISQTTLLVSRMRALLKRAIRSGGSTLRDYVGADGRAGGFQFRHKVYGRTGESCILCKDPLTRLQVAGRTTVYCTTCQV